jgi:hypothetical protein
LYFSSFDFSSYARVPLNTGLHTTVWETKIWSIALMLIDFLFLFFHGSEV